jgi:O-methyltransferase involved in polyketide biosynthesis
MEFDKALEKHVDRVDQVVLMGAGLTYAGINYVSVDFEHESWVEKLIENGFDSEKKTLFLCEILCGRQSGQICGEGKSFHG